MRYLIAMMLLVASCGIANAATLVQSLYTDSPEQVSELLETTGDVETDYSKDGFLDVGPGENVNPAGLIEMHFRDWRKNVRWVFDYAGIVGVQMGPGIPFGGYGAGYYSTMFPSFRPPSGFVIGEEPVFPPDGFVIGEEPVGPSDGFGIGDGDEGGDGDEPGFGIDDMSPIPEPVTMSLLGAGACMLLARRRKTAN